MSRIVGMSMVSFVEVTKLFGSVKAVDRLSLEVEKAEFLTLLGPSGSGKTTALMLVAGFELPSSGEIYIAGEAVASKPPHKRDNGIVFQHYALFPHLTVFENVAFPLKVRRFPKGEIARRVGEVLELVKLGGLESRLPRQLSGGQQQRVALARALVYRPSVLLMDEPLGALDRKLRESMQLEIKRIQRQLGITTIYVTHDQQEALTMSDRIAVMNHGRIEQLGAPEVLYERPGNEFVASFLGESNFLHGTVKGVDGETVVIDTAGGREIRAASSGPWRVGSRLKVVVRPEKMTLEVSRDPARNCLEGVVKEVIYHGEIVRFRVELVGGEAVVVARQNVGVNGASLEGARVWACWPPGNSILWKEE